MNGSKYVVGPALVGVVVIDVAIIFPTTMNHQQVAISMFRGTATSAGFFYIDEERNVVTFGESVGLGLAPRKTDAKLIARALSLRVAD